MENENKNLMEPAEETAEVAQTDEEAEEEPGAMRKVGFSRFWELMGRDLWPFYKASLLCCLGFAPGFAAVVAGLFLAQPVLCVVGGVLGGAFAGPFLCGLCDTVLRALRDEPGYWWHTYRTAWKQNWRDALIPGAILGLFGGLWPWLLYGMTMMQNVPTLVWICMIVGAFLAMGYLSYVFAQIPLVSLSLKQILKNAGLFFIGCLPRTLGAAAVLCVYWGLVLLYMPYTLPVLLVTGFWLPVVIALLVLYVPLEKTFHLEKTINERRDAELQEHPAPQYGDEP